MPRLAEHQIQHIIELLREGKELPLDYKYLLFPPEQQWAEISTSTGPSQGSVLVVDDNPSNRQLLLDQLEWLGHVGTPAENGRLALKQLQERKFDLVLLDIMMPELDGYETLAQIKAKPELRHIPVIMISAVDDLASVVRCIEMGAEDYLPKPFNPILLKARVTASLEKKRLRDQEQEYLRQLEIEQEKSERLLLNILPRPIAEQLKRGQSTIADNFAEVTVLFADIVDFTRFSAQISPAELIELLNEMFSTFDHLAEQHGLEKIKTIGDAYMAVGGLPTPRNDHAEAVADMALDLQAAITDFTRGNGESFALRIGINTGPVIAGVIGTSKFIYDLWGDTVNMASRMETQGIPGAIQVTRSTYEHLADQYLFEERGEIHIKGRGVTPAYLLLGKA